MVPTPWAGTGTTYDFGEFEVVWLLQITRMPITSEVLGDREALQYPRDPSVGLYAVSDTPNRCPLLLQILRQRRYVSGDVCIERSVA